MKKLIAWMWAAGSVLLACGTEGYSQTANPLAPPLPSPRIGVEAGIMINQQSGTYISDCGCGFTSGKGNGFFIGGIYEMFLTPKLELIGKAGFRFGSISAKNANDTNEETVDQSTQMRYKTGIGVNENADLKITYLTIIPMIRYNIYKGLFIAAGPSLGLAFSSHALVQESIGQNGYTFADGSTTRTIRDDVIPNVSAIRFGIAGTVGYDIPVSPTLFFAPSFSIDLPLTAAQSGADWKIMAFQISGAIKWSMHPTGAQ